MLKTAGTARGPDHRKQNNCAIWLVDWCFTARQHKIDQFVPIYLGDYSLRRLRIANVQLNSIETLNGN